MFESLKPTIGSQSEPVGLRTIGDIIDHTRIIAYTSSGASVEENSRLEDNTIITIRLEKIVAEL